jgi:hypothetical protein
MHYLWKYVTSDRLNLYYFKVEVLLLATYNVRGSPYILTVHVVQRFVSDYFFSLFICVFFSWGTPPSTLSNSPTEDKLNKAGVDRSSTVIAKEPEGKSELIFKLISELLSVNVFNNILLL